ncbi:MAG: type II toxin-antitoxin system RelE/ParE family toxin [Chitinophagaceae bacterium]|nr:type II toxin-antitoxin system RelE/ParE family toxin [Chitinophagaceae bacterium]
MVELIWAPSAIKAINEIAEYISKDSILAAENTVQLFFEKAELLIRFPEYGKPVPELKDKKFREINVSSFRIIYELVSINVIHILTVHHHARLLRNNPVFKSKLRSRRK